LEFPTHHITLLWKKSFEQVQEFSTEVGQTRSKKVVMRFIHSASSQLMGVADVFAGWMGASSIET
jgi:hypothetical protein